MADLDPVYPKQGDQKHLSQSPPSGNNYQNQKMYTPPKDDIRNYKMYKPTEPDIRNYKAFSGEDI